MKVLNPNPIKAFEGVRLKIGFHKCSAEFSQYRIDTMSWQMALQMKFKNLNVGSGRLFVKFGLVGNRGLPKLFFRSSSGSLYVFDKSPFCSIAPIIRTGHVLEV